LKIVGLVHDEILCLVADGQAEAAKDWLHEILLVVGEEVVNHGVSDGKRVSVDAGTEICSSWGEKP
jgi:hypothetical protein